jgi:hypothetical protein
MVADNLHGKISVTSSLIFMHIEGDAEAVTSSTCGTEVVVFPSPNSYGTMT